MEKKLPFTVWTYGVMIAAFNAEVDAKDFAVAQSYKYTNGWKEVRANDGHDLLFAYENGRLVFQREAV